jgi:hypothetical protein
MMPIDPWTQKKMRQLLNSGPRTFSITRQFTLRGTRTACKLDPRTGLDAGVRMRTVQCAPEQWQVAGLAASTL